VAVGLDILQRAHRASSGLACMRGLMWPQPPTVMLAVDAVLRSQHRLRRSRLLDGCCTRASLTPVVAVMWTLVSELQWRWFAVTFEMRHEPEGSRATLFRCGPSPVLALDASSA